MIARISPAWSLSLRGGGEEEIWEIYPPPIRFFLATVWGIFMINWYLVNTFSHLPPPPNKNPENDPVRPVHQPFTVTLSPWLPKIKKITTLFDCCCLILYILHKQTRTDGKSVLPNSYVETLRIIVIFSFKEKWNFWFINDFKRYLVISKLQAKVLNYFHLNGSFFQAVRVYYRSASIRKLKESCEIVC